jgi:hypothetical protein
MSDVENKALVIENTGSELLKVESKYLPIFSMYWEIQGVTETDKFNSLYIMLNGERTYITAPLTISFIAAHNGLRKEKLDETTIRCLKEPLTEIEKNRKKEYEETAGKNEKETTIALLFIRAKEGFMLATIELTGTFKAFWSDALLAAQFNSNKAIILSKTDLTSCFEKGKKNKKFLDSSKFKKIWKQIDLKPVDTNLILQSVAAQKAKIDLFLNQ